MAAVYPRGRRAVHPGLIGDVPGLGGGWWCRGHDEDFGAGRSPGLGRDFLGSSNIRVDVVRCGRAEVCGSRCLNTMDSAALVLAGEQMGVV